MKRIGSAIIVSVFALAGCQTTGVGTQYTIGSITSEPNRLQFTTAVEYAANFTIYKYPRRCRFFETSDGVRNSENKRAGNFTVAQLIENKYDDGWFLATVQPVEAVHNALQFYVNARTGAWACGDTHRKRIASNAPFSNGKFYDAASVLKSLGPTRSEPQPVKTVQKKIADETVPPSSMYDGRLCHFALDSFKWDNSGQFYRYAEEAKARGFSISDCMQKAAFKANTKTSVAGISSGTGESRPLAMQWEGYSKLIAGTVNLNQGKKGGTVSVTLPRNDGTCAGRYTMDTKTAGTWSLTCTNGMAASGTLTAYGSGKGSSGEGKDTKGNRVSYTLGGR